MPVEVAVPFINANDPKAEIIEWFKEQGQEVRKGEDLCEILTSKISVVLQAESDGYLERLADLHQKVGVGQPIARLHPKPEDVPIRKSVSIAATDIEGPVFSRAALRAMRAHGMNPSQVSAGGFVTSKDLRQGGRTRDQAIKDAEIESLQRAYHQVLRSSLSLKIDADPVQKMADSASVGTQAVWTQTVAKALIQFPDLCRHKGPHKLGYAIDLGDGIKLFQHDLSTETPLEKWHERILSWTMQCGRRQYEAGDVGPGDFVVSDLSHLGVAHFEPLIVGDHRAILGVGLERNSRYAEYTLTLAFDHRFLTGRRVALFLNEIKKSVLGAAEE